MESKIKNPPNPVPVIIQDLQKDFTCPTCDNILCKAVTSECCGIKMCSHCFDISLKDKTCPFCRKNCKSAVRCTNIDAEIFAAFLKVPPEFQEERELFLKIREVDVAQYNFEQIEDEEQADLRFPLPDQEYPRYPLPDEEAVKCQTVKPSEPGPDTMTKKGDIEGRRSVDKDGSVKKHGKHRRLRHSGVQPKPAKEPLETKSADALLKQFISWSNDDGLENNTKMHNSSSAIRIPKWCKNAADSKLASIEKANQKLADELSSSYDCILSTLSGNKFLEEGFGQGDNKRREPPMPPPPPGSPPIGHKSRIPSASAVLPTSAVSIQEGQPPLPSTSTDLTPKDFAQNKIEMKNATTEQMEILNYLKAMDKYLNEEGNMASNLKSLHLIQSAKLKQTQKLGDEEDELLEYLEGVQDYLDLNPFESLLSDFVIDRTGAISKAPPMSRQLHLENSDDEFELTDRDEIEEQERLQYLQEVEDCMMDDKMKYFVPDSATKFQLAGPKTPPKSAAAMRKEFEEFQASIDKITKEPEVENDGEMDSATKLDEMLVEMAKSHEKTQKLRKRLYERPQKPSRPFSDFE